MSLITKANKDDTEILRKRLDEFAIKKDFVDLEKLVLPALENVKIQLATSNNERQQFHEMIRRFDEVICDKASKTSVTEVIF